MDTILFFVSSTRHSCRNRLNGILAVAQKHKWHVQVIERAFQHVNVAEAIDFWKPIGIIAECGSRAEEMNRKAFGKIPAVYFERDPALGRGDTVLMLDSTAVGRLAAQELLSSGFSNFAYIPFPRDPTIYWSVERGAAFVTELEKSGHTVHVPTNLDNATALRTFLANLPKPCAIFAANDQVAVEIISLAVTAGFEIPRDVQVLGVDNDLELCENSDPKVSSIDPDFLAAGFLAAAQLEEMIEKKTRATKLIKFRPIGVIRRRSTAPAPLDPNAKLSARVNAFIAANIDGGLKVPDIVRAFKISRRTLETQYAAEAKHTLLEAIHDEIFKRATQMARNPQLVSCAIPDFLQVSHDTLNRIFLERTGKTLHHWRRSCQ